MATTNLNIRTDKDVKDQAEEIFNELDLQFIDLHKKVIKLINDLN